MPRYNASRGGHAPGHIREALHAYLEDGDQPLDGHTIGQLWNCTDIMPSEYCDELDLPAGSTYAQAVRHLAMVWHRAQA